MWRYVFAAFLIAHGLIHVTVWLAPASPDAPFRVDHSWLLGSGETAHRTSIALAACAAIVFTTAGVALLVGAPAWETLTLGGAVVGLAVSFLYFNPWLLTDVAINAGLLYAVLVTDWPDSLLA